MKVREGRNASGGVWKAGARRGGHSARSRFPGEECQHEQQSLPAAIHPAPRPSPSPRQRCAPRHVIFRDFPLSSFYEAVDRYSIRSIFKNRRVLPFVKPQKVNSLHFFKRDRLINDVFVVRRAPCTRRSLHGIQYESASRHSPTVCNVVQK